MGVRVVVDQLTPFIGQVKARLKESRAVLLGPIADDIRATFQAIFMSAGAYAGEAWPALSEATMARKRGNSAMILVETGELWRSLTQPGAAHSVCRVIMEGGAPELVLGTDLEYAEYHQTGTPNMPRRPILPDVWPEADTERWAEAFGHYLLSGELG